MIKHYLNIILPLFLAVGLLTLSECKKDPVPNFYGNWKTVEALGYPYEYNIEKDGRFCKKYVEGFGELYFCNDFEVISDTEIKINANWKEVWVWNFISYDVAEVVATYDDSTKYIRILRRF